MDLHTPIMIDGTLCALLQNSSNLKRLSDSPKGHSASHIELQKYNLSISQLGYKFTTKGAISIPMQ